MQRQYITEQELARIMTKFTTNWIVTAALGLRNEAARYRRSAELLRLCNYLSWAARMEEKADRLEAQADQLQKAVTQ